MSDPAPILTSMSADVWVSIVALVVAVGSVLYARGSVKEARRSADAAEAQVAGMRESNVAAAQPYVWADVRSADDQSMLLDLVVGNSGPTVAQNVRVEIDPPLPTVGAVADDLTRKAMERMRNGMRSLAPGKTLYWHLGYSATILETDQPQIHRVTVDADGPFGPVPRLTYEVDLSDFRESNSRPSGTLHRLTRAVDGVAKELKEGRKNG